MSKVMLLEDNEDMRLLMAKFLTLKLGCQCLGLSSVSALKARREEVVQQDVAILDIDLGTDQPSGLDAWQWMSTLPFSGKIIFLTGQAKSNPLVNDVRRAGAIVIEKPVRPEDLVNVVREMIGTGTPEATL